MLAVSRRRIFDEQDGEVCAGIGERTEQMSEYDELIATLKNLGECQIEEAAQAANAIQSLQARVKELEADAESMNRLLIQIGNKAHDALPGPAVPDVLWEIRSMAYQAE
jgi:predicted nuclease with TOPRIM domain